MNKSTQTQSQYSLRSSQKGQSLIEYLIIVALVAVGAMGIMRVLGQTISIKYAQIAKSLGASVEGDGISKSTITDSLHKKKDLGDFMTGAESKSEK